jgi:hypothetical protein
LLRHRKLNHSEPLPAHKKATSECPYFNSHTSSTKEYIGTLIYSLRKISNETESLEEEKE